MLLLGVYANKLLVTLVGVVDYLKILLLFVLLLLLEELKILF